MQLRGDAAVREPGADQLDYLPLALGERVDAVLWPRRAATLAGDTLAQPAQFERGLVVQAARVLVAQLDPSLDDSVNCELPG